MNDRFVWKKEDIIVVKRGKDEPELPKDDDQLKEAPPKREEITL